MNGKARGLYADLLSLERLLAVFQEVAGDLLG